MSELHPSPSARSGNIPSNAVTTGIHADRGPFSANREVWCEQCGFRCNLDRDAKNVNEFAGETITIANTITNGSFENWTAGFPANWSITSSGTAIGQETTSGNYDWTDGGTSSARMTRSGSNLSLFQTISSPSDFNNDIITFRARVKSSTNGVIRLRVKVNSTNYYSSYNIAQQRFQELSILVNKPVTVSTLTVYILADNAGSTISSATAYVDQVFLSRYGNPTTASVNAGCPHCGSFNYFTR